MSNQFTIQVSEQAIREVRRIAAQTRQSVEDIVVNLIESYFDETPVELLSDEELLAITGSVPTMAEQERIGDLLYKDRKGLLEAEEHEKLIQLMRIQDHILLRKIKAQDEVSKRKLILS